MKAILTNLELQPGAWEAFSREQLNTLAERHGIMKGTTRKQAAMLLSMGAQYETDKPKEFSVSIELHEPKIKGHHF